MIACGMTDREQKASSVIIEITVSIRPGTSPFPSAQTLFLLHLRHASSCLWKIFIPFLGKTLANKISFNVGGGRTEALAPPCLLAQLLPGIRWHRLFREAWPLQKLVEASGEPRSRSCLYLHADRRSPGLLVSAGSASSCPRCWQSAVRLEEEMVFSSLLGRSISLQYCSLVSRV